MVKQRAYSEEKLKKKADYLTTYNASKEVLINTRHDVKEIC